MSDWPIWTCNRLGPLVSAQALLQRRVQFAFGADFVARAAAEHFRQLVILPRVNVVEMAIGMQEPLGAVTAVVEQHDDRRETRGGQASTVPCRSFETPRRRRSPRPADRAAPLARPSAAGTAKAHRRVIGRRDEFGPFAHHQFGGRKQRIANVGNHDRLIVQHFVQPGGQPPNRDRRIGANDELFAIVLSVAAAARAAAAAATLRPAPE